MPTPQDSSRLSSVVVLMLAFACLLGTGTHAVAQGTRTQIVVFGDSLSDPGNAFALAGGTSTPPDYGMGPLLLPNAPYARGGHHLTNGATWIEQLARPLGLSASVQPAFRGSSPYAMNFSIATARARAGGGPVTLAFQIATFLQKTGGTAPSEALYVIQLGGNDIRDALASPADADAILQAAVEGIVNAIQQLYAAGARDFLVWNVADVGLTPAVRLLGPQAVAGASLATDAFNGLLGLALLQLAGLPGIHIALFDAASLLDDIVASPGAFGLTNVTDACVTPNVPPYACQNPDEYLFWDGAHPTAAVHRIIAGAVAQLLGF